VAEHPGEVAGPLLEQLAFDTDVDLDRARRLLVELWEAHHAGSAQAVPAAAAQPEPSDDEPSDDEGSDDEGSDDDESEPADDGDESAPADGETLGARLLRTLDAGLAQRKDVDELFSELEAMAGIEPEDGDDDDGPPVGEAGDLGPLVTEFLWETRRGGSETEAVLRLWLGLQQNAALPHLDLEQVTSQDLLRLLLHVYLRAEPQQRAPAARAAFAALREFSAWAEETQEMSLGAALTECEALLLEPIDRLQAAGLRLSGAGTDAARQQLLRVEDVGEDGFGVRGDEGHHWLLADCEAAALLRPGDLVLGSLAPGRRGALRGLVVVLPGCAEALIG